MAHRPIDGGDLGSPLRAAVNPGAAGRGGDSPGVLVAEPRAAAGPIAVTLAEPHATPLPGQRIPALVLGGSGYVGGELLRLLAGHPVLEPAIVVSESKPGEPVEVAFPHLAGCFPGLRFCAAADLPRMFARHPQVAGFCAAPHGAAASLVDGALGAAESAGCDLPLVDMSADFRFAEAAAWEEVYGKPHGAPARNAAFVRGVPELVAGAPGRQVAHPGCFTTATLLAAVPLVKLGLVEPSLTVVATTGSTGAGRTLTNTTHHPERRSDLFAYGPLAHRHQPEMEAFAAAAGAAATLRFVPQAGPFARGIYATLVGRPAPGVTATAARAALADFYAGAPFVEVVDAPPHLTSVVGTNRCRLAVATDGDAFVAFSALDNLVKGAAGGAIQWMNRLLGLPETTGLLVPGLGWL
jgi:N-acetyl-gamma-glutamyl-phosphate reductase common form